MPVGLRYRTVMLYLHSYIAGAYGFSNTRVGGVDRKSGLHKSFPSGCVYRGSYCRYPIDIEDRDRNIGKSIMTTNPARSGPI